MNALTNFLRSQSLAPTPMTPIGRCGFLSAIISAPGADGDPQFGAVDEVEHLYGTMIEIPRAALTADQIAESVEFFSFGTNDLTQMTFGFSRDDIGGFLGDYLDKKILPVDPFQVLDRDSVGVLVQTGIDKGRSVKPDLKVGICGEHGGEPNSVEFCHLVGMNYVSCSPYRVPIARLAAAHAQLSDELEVDQLYSVVVGDLERRGGRRRLYIVYSDAMRIARTDKLEVALAGLRRDLTLWVGENSTERIFVHAGAVAHGGRAILLPGRTMSGKSTLVQALLRAGCSYLSDEFALLDLEGRVHPYARPMQIRPPGEYSGAAVQPEELGAEVESGPLPVGLVVLTRYRRGARWATRHQEPGRALLGMLEHALAARAHPDLVVPALQRIAQQAVVVKSVRDEASEAADRILRLHDEHPRRP